MHNVEPQFFANYAELATNQLREDALAIMNAGLLAVATPQATKLVVRLEKNMLYVHDHEFNLENFKNIFVIGVGKAAVDACSALEEILEDRITDGVVLDIREKKLKHLKSLAGSHPFPSEKNVNATKHIAEILERAGGQDLVIVVISGGGSSLLCWPHQLSCDNLTFVTESLFKAGADIKELNTVRKHLSKILGGQFAQLAQPATVVGLVYSDVPGNDLSLIASGPTVLDQTTVADATNILKKFAVISDDNSSSLGLTETPKDESIFEHVHNFIVTSSLEATTAMQQKASELGYQARVHDTEVAGEAREVGREIARLPEPGEAIIAAGETTVTIEQDGEGGRNLEATLGALQDIEQNTLFASLASDGKDNVPVAGAVADYDFLKIAEEKNLSPEKALKENSSYKFVQQVGNILDTGGPTGINVSDLMLALRAK